MRRSVGIRTSVLAVALLGSLVATVLPAQAITGGTEDTTNIYSNVGMVVFYNATGRHRCSGSLIAPRVVLTAGHCTFGDVGKVIVTFDPVISRTDAEAERDVPRAADDSGPTDGISAIGYTSSDLKKPRYRGEQTWVLGSSRTHPQYSDFTDVNNWNDTGVVVLETAVSLPTRPLAPENYLDAYPQPILNSTSFLTIGYGVQIGGNPPAAEREPIVRRYTTEIGQKLTIQLLQTNGNDKDPRAGGATCFGDSGGPINLNGYIVGDTSYGYTNNCRYIDGYQRVDIPVVRNWVLDCVADLVCPTNP